MAKSKGKGRIRTVDFSQANKGGSVLIPPGKYDFKFISMEEKERDDDNHGYNFKFKGTSGKAKGKTFWLYATDSVEGAWKLREVLHALGIGPIPFEEFDIDLDEIDGAEGHEVVGHVKTDNWEGKDRSKLQTLEKDDSIEEDDNGEGEGEDEGRGSRRGTSRSRGGRDEENDRGSRRSNGKGKAKVTEDEIREMDEDDLASLSKKNKLDVDLDDFKTISKKRTAVVEAMEQADLL